MDIYIAHSIAGGGGGGGLRGPLAYLDRIILDALDSASFKSTFEEFWLTLNYPPTYVLSDVAGIEVDYLGNHYNTLPTSRMDRRYKKIEISLKAPEFSEHFNKALQANYKGLFDVENQYKNIDIEDQYKNISEIDLAKIAIDKFIEAGSIVNSKLKDGDVFDFELFKYVLLSLQQKIDLTFLISENKKKQDEITSFVLKRAIDSREQRKKSNRPKDKIIRDFRVYPLKSLERALYPFDMQYAEIFRNILRKKQLMCPGYNHVYIQIGESFEECLASSISLEDWSACGLAVMNYNNYLNRSDIEKERIVFDVIATGLKDIADIDGLDKSIVDSSINEIKENGLNTELEYKTIENNHYKLKISYLSGNMEDGCPIFLTITEKSSNITRKILMGNANNFQIYLWLQKISLTKTHIRIKSSNSITANVWLEDKPRSMEFSIKEILNG